MKLAFKYSLLVLNVLLGLFGAIGTYFIFSMGYQIDPIQYHYPFLALFSITGFSYHKKTLFFYKKNHERTRTTYALDEDLVLDDLQTPHIGWYIWLPTFVSALHLMGYLVHSGMFFWDEIKTKNLLEPIMIILVLCLYLSIGTLLDLIGVSKKTKRQARQQP